MRASPQGEMVNRPKAKAEVVYRQEKEFKKFLAVVEVICIMRLPRLELNAHRFFNS